MLLLPPADGSKDSPRLRGATDQTSSRRYFAAPSDSRDRAALKASRCPASLHNNASRRLWVVKTTSGRRIKDLCFPDEGRYADVTPPLPPGLRLWAEGVELVGSERR